MQVEEGEVQMILFQVVVQEELEVMEVEEQVVP
jgi:hypothetical protein